MSWTTAIGRARAFLGKGKPAEREDAGLPLGGQIGSLVKFRVSSFLRAAGSLVPMPEDGQQVQSISRLRVDIQGTVHRYYLERGDGGRGNERFLQVYTDVTGAVTELVYFTRLLRLYPTSPEEQSAYLGEDGRGLGEVSFSLSCGQLETLDLDPQVLAAAMPQPDGGDVPYIRAAGPADAHHVQPFRGLENRIDDTQGIHGLRQEVVFMPYERTLAGGAREQLLISTEILKDQDGQAQREIHVDFMVGLVLTSADVTIQ